MKIIAMFVIALSLALTACGSTPKTVKVEISADLNSMRIPAGIIEAQFDKTFQFKKESVEIEYFPREDLVCLKFRNEFVTYYQFWSKSNREAFVSALEKYKEDYVERRLGKNSRKAKQQYGAVYGFIIWQMARFAIQAKSTTDIEMGYYFKNKAPYFTLNQLEAYYEDAVSKENNRRSKDIMIYFTRAQADNLKGFFDQEFLWNLIPSGVSNFDDVEQDEY